MALTDNDFQQAANLLGCEVAAIRAVSDVESSGDGMLRDGRVKILFEGHIFSKYTDRKFDESNPTISYKTWTTANYAKGPDSEARGQGEWQRYGLASSLDARAAMLSCSLGRFQIMGFNFSLCSFKTVEDFWSTLSTGEAAQLVAFCNYVRSVQLTDDLQRKYWESFARRYNGPMYLKNDYANKLQAAYRKYAI